MSGKTAMQIKKKTFFVQTGRGIGTHDISGEVAEFVRESGLGEGMIFVYCPHATASVFLNENEPGLQRDVLGLIRRLVPQSERYEHNAIDHNAAAHLAAILVGNCVAVPVTGGGLGTGTWQEVFLLEMDGPRRRTVNLIAIGE